MLLAKCHLLRLDWISALETANKALDFNKKDVRAMVLKGEALFNVCQFEHALLYFYRAQVNFASLILLLCESDRLSYIFIRFTVILL